MQRLHVDRWRGRVPTPDPKTSEALASSCDFQVVIWSGWTSKCSASCPMVRSPLTAAKATFALKAGVRFRRGCLLMISHVHGDYRRCQAEIPLIVLCRFPGPALGRSVEKNLTLFNSRFDVDGHAISNADMIAKFRSSFGMQYDHKKTVYLSSSPPFQAPTRGPSRSGTAVLFPNFEKAPNGGPRGGLRPNWNRPDHKRPCRHQ